MIPRDSVGDDLGMQLLWKRRDDTHPVQARREGRDQHDADNRSTNRDGPGADKEPSTERLGGESEVRSKEGGGSERQPGRANVEQSCSTTSRCVSVRYASTSQAETHRERESTGIEGDGA